MKPLNVRDFIRRTFPGVRDKDTLISISHHSSGHGFEAQSAPRESQSSGHVVEAEAGLAVAQPFEGMIVTTLPDDGVMLDNNDPLKASVNLHKPPRGLRRRIGITKNRLLSFYRFLRPPLTAEQLLEREHQKEYKQFTALMSHEAVRYAAVISNRLAQLNYMQIVPTEDGKAKERKVRFSVAAWDWNEETREGGRVIKLLVDTNSLPRGVRLGALSSPETVDEMLPTLHHPMSVTMDREGCIFTIQRGGVLGLPEIVNIEKIWGVMGENRPPLSFCAGETENSRVLWVDLAKCPHVMIAGASGQGKSNMINSVLCTLIRNNPAHMLNLVLFDMKEGIEFTFYENLPHLYRTAEIPGIVDNPTKADAAMRVLKEVMVRRLNVIKQAGHKNIYSYNLHRYAKNRMPYLVVAFDEIATPLLYFGKTFERLLNELTNQARAAGMHFIMGTQYPKAEILTTLVTINFPVRFGFLMPMGASMSVLGNHNAVGLPCPGRAILQREGEDNQVQTPLISDAIVRASVLTAITGTAEAAPPLAIEELLTYALDNLNGELRLQELFDHFRKQEIRYQFLKQILLAADNQEYELAGERYRVEPRFGKTPRRLVRLHSEPADSAETS
jgi:hypothetical protein